MGAMDAGAGRGFSYVNDGGSMGARATVLCCAPVRGREAWDVSGVIVLSCRATFKAIRAR